MNAAHLPGHARKDRGLLNSDLLIVGRLKSINDTKRWFEDRLTLALAGRSI